MVEDPEVRRGLARYLPRGLAKDERWTESMLQAPQEERPFALDVRQGDAWQHIGGSGLMPIDPRPGMPNSESTSGMSASGIRGWAPRPRN